MKKEPEKDDGLGFLRKAADEREKQANEKAKMMAMQETAYKKLSELDYNLVGFKGQRADSYSGNSAGMGGMNSIGQSNLTG